MKVQSILLNICLILATGCLGIGYIMAGYWLILPTLILVLLFWIFTKRRSVFWRASGVLLAYILMVAIGIVLNLSLGLMIVACSAALISWDLILFTQRIAETSPKTTNLSFEKVHMRSLALAASVGMAAAFISASINLHFSFGLIVVLVLMAVGCLVFAVRYIMKKVSSQKVGEGVQIRIDHEETT